MRLGITLSIGLHTLIILITLVYMSKQKVWSRFGTKETEVDDDEAFDKVERVVTKYEGEDPKTFK